MLHFVHLAAGNKKKKMIHMKRDASLCLMADYNSLCVVKNTSHTEKTSLEEWQFKDFCVLHVDRWKKNGSKHLKIH